MTRSHAVCLVNGVKHLVQMQCALYAVVIIVSCVMKMRSVNTSETVLLTDK